MKHFLIRSFTAVSLGLLLGAAAQPAAAAYNPAIVGADARWVLHADLNGLRSSQLGKEFVTALEKAQANASGGIIGVNIPKVLATVGTLTAYGSNLTPEPAKIDGTLIAQGAPELRKIAESILLQGTLAEPNVFAEVTDLPFAAYSITDVHAPEGKRTQLIIAFPPEPIVIVSKSRAQLIKARDVFRGAAPSLAKAADSPINKLAANAEGAYLFAASIVPAEPIFPEKAPQTRMLQLTKSGSIALGERGPDLFAHVELSASSDRNAEKLTKILEGMTSMLSLAESNDRQLAEFLNATTVTRENDLVTMQLAYPAARLVQMMQNLRAQAEARPAQRQLVITNGQIAAEWTAADVEPTDASTPNAVSWRTIENVKLNNGTVISLGRAMNGGKNARFDRVEIVPADGAGAPLVFRPDFMRSRGPMQQFAFPGADGVYTLKVAFINDPAGKAKFAVSTSEPRSPEPAKSK